MGRDALRERLPSSLEDAGDIRLRLGEFEASGRLAHGVGSYECQTVGSGGAGEMRRGRVMIVFLKSGAWKIRSRLFRPDRSDG